MGQIGNSQGHEDVETREHAPGPPYWLQDVATSPGTRLLNPSRTRFSALPFLPFAVSRPLSVSTAILSDRVLAIALTVGAFLCTFEPSPLAFSTVTAASGSTWRISLASRTRPAIRFTS